MKPFGFVCMGTAVAVCVGVCVVLFCVCGVSVSECVCVCVDRFEKIICLAGGAIAVSFVALKGVQFVREGCPMC
jgi:hypothetical protein